MFGDAVRQYGMCGNLSSPYEVGKLLAHFFCMVFVVHVVDMKTFVVFLVRLVRAKSVNSFMVDMTVLIKVLTIYRQVFCHHSGVPGIGVGGTVCAVAGERLCGMVGGGGGALGKWLFFLPCA